MGALAGWEWLGGGGGANRPSYEGEALRWLLLALSDRSGGGGRARRDLSRGCWNRCRIERNVEVGEHLLGGFGDYVSDEGGEQGRQPFCDERSELRGVERILV